MSPHLIFAKFTQQNITEVGFGAVADLSWYMVPRRI